MFAINHAATALIFKKKFPEVKMLWLLLSVQFIEFIWAGLNFVGIEKTSTEPVVNYIGDIHLYHMPFSHSILSSLILSLIAFVIARLVTKNYKIAFVISLAVVSHIILDLLVHAKDIPFSFFSTHSKFGSQLYNLFPYLAFVSEFAYGIFCWFYFKGSKSLLYILVGFNLANFTIFSPDIVGLESMFANHQVFLTSVILVQIIITLFLVGRYARQNSIWAFAKNSNSELVSNL